MAYEIEVPVRHRTLWLAFTDPEKMARAVPGLTVDAVQPVDASAAPEGVSGDVIAGRLRLKVGTGTITYRGTARIADAAAQDGTLDVAIDVAQARGSGALAGYLRITLTPSGDKTTVSVVPELELSGRALEFGSAELAEAASALAGQWLTALADEWVSAEPETVVEPVVEETVDEAGDGETEAGAGTEEVVAAARSEEAVAEAAAEETVVETAAVTEAAGSVERTTTAEVAAPVAATSPSADSQDSDSEAALLPVPSTTPETLLDDSLSGDPLATLWRGEVERPRWPRAVAAIGIMLLIRRRRRRRRSSGRG